MADFSPPFANDGERRVPTSDEQLLGFGCGPADQFMFNWMFWSIQSEINAVIESAGLTPTNADMTQLMQAIQSMIDASSGGAGDANYVLMTQARARIPIFPDVQTVDGKFGISSPGVGLVRVPASVSFLHRGIFQVTSAQTDFSTDASKTYHLRWNPTDGFNLKDVANAVYNPASLAEDNAVFDSTYDNMLIARVVTNSSNVATITDLSNKSDLFANIISDLTPAIVGFDTPSSYTTLLENYNWARTPRNWDLDVVDSGAGNGIQGFRIFKPDNSGYGYNFNRYRVHQRIIMDEMVRMIVKFSVRA